MPDRLPPPGPSFLREHDVALGARRLRAAMDRPWSAPLVVQLAVRWEPARAATMTPNALADAALAAFCRAVESVHRP